MSNLLQLLHNYDMSVIECEKFYFEQLLKDSKVESNTSNKDSASNFNGTLKDNSISNELVSLQRQLTKVSVELQSMKHENEQLKASHKSMKGSMNQKLNNSLKTIEKLKSELSSNNIHSSGTERSSSGTPPQIFTAMNNNEAKAKNDIHLLLPVAEKKDQGSDSIVTGTKFSQIRKIINSKKHSLFDVDSESENDISLNSFDKALRITTLKRNEKLSNMIFPKDALSDNSDVNASQTLTKNDVPHPNEPSKNDENDPKVDEYNLKKRKLTKKRIQKIDSDDSFI